MSPLVDRAAGDVDELDLKTVVFLGTQEALSSHLGVERKTI